MTNMSSVNIVIEDNIAIIKGSNPPVNALSFDVRTSLINCLNELIKNNNIEGIILTGDGRTFFAGADIAEFGKPMKLPDLTEVINHFEVSTKPIVAALHGTPLGGGLELAMGCNYRVAMSTSSMGLPEVKLGIIPGAGGTQRLPRLVGIEKSLEMITSGNPISAHEALRFGLVSEVYENNLIENAKNFIANKISKNTHPITSKNNDKIKNIDLSIFDSFQNHVKSRYRITNLCY